MIDFHVHSTFSDGQEEVETLIDLAAKRGVRRLAITDHFDSMDPSLRNKNATAEELRAHFTRIRAYAAWKRKTTPIRVFCGVETCTDMDGQLRLPEECVKECDVIITSPHYVEGEYPFQKGQYFLDSYWEKYKQKLLAMAAGEGDVLGHPMGYLPIGPMLEEGTTFMSRQAICKDICARYFDKDFICRLGAALKRSGKACELHGASSTPPDWAVKLLHGQGAIFSVGSDAHSAELLGKNERAMRLASELGLRLWMGKEPPVTAAQEETW